MVCPVAVHTRGLTLPMLVLVVSVISIVLVSVSGALVPSLGLVPGVREVARVVAPVISSSASPPPAATVGGPGGVVVAVPLGLGSLVVSLLVSCMGSIACVVLHPVLGATGFGVPPVVLDLGDSELVFWALGHIIGHPMVV